jgi:hypothetical protein
MQSSYALTQWFYRILALAFAPALFTPGLALAGSASLPLFFVPNQGLADPRFQYLVQTPRLHAGFAQDSVVFQLPANHLELRFPGANPAAGITASGGSGGHANFLTGSTPDRWRTEVPIFSEILYRDLYPGIELAYGGSGAELKAEFRVAPGADPARIRLRYSQTIGGAGAVTVVIDDDGDLLVRDGAAELREKAPDVYQDTPHGRVQIPARYRLLDAHTAGFELGTYDAGRPLIIDPVISYSTYLGGSNPGAVTAIAVDANDNLYIAGWTSAANFPTYAPYQSFDAGGDDVIVAKLNSAGTALIYATYIGGQGADEAAGIAVDSMGEAYVTGFTESRNFPLASPIRATLGGSRTAFVLKLNSAGNGLIFSTYLGGTAYDLGTAIALDSAGDAWVAGDTQSANFPTKAPLQATFGGVTDIFLAKLTPAGALSFSTFWGGSGAEHAGGVAVDHSGDIYVAGGTYSTNFPVVAPLQPANGGNQDAFILKINSSATAVIYSTYLGGNGAITPEQANGIAADASGNAYVTGVTNSANFPVTAGTVQTTYDGDQDAFVAKINPTGSALVYSTFLGGTSFDWGSGIALDTSGNAYIAGYTSSFDFPIAGSAMQTSLTGLYNAFVSMLNTTGGVLAFSTYYGGTGADEANAIAVDSSGNMFVAGQTNSTNFPLETPFQSTNIGGAIGWAARLGVTAAPPQTSSVVSLTPSSGTGATVVFTATYSDTGGASAITTAGLLVNSSPAITFACFVTYSPATNLFSLAGDTSSSPTNTTPPGGATIQNDACVLNGAASSVAISGDTLTLTISLYFEPAFAGPQTVYLSAADAGTATGFVALGTWTATIPAPQPSVVSVAPNAGSGIAQTFVFSFADASSASNLADVAILFSSTSQTVTNACYIVVDRNENTVALVWNNALGSNSKPIGSATVLSNSQCSVGANSLSLTGQQLSLTMTISFNGAFAGVQNIYGEAAEVGINTGWDLEGTFTVLAYGIPVAVSVVPDSGAGTGQRFSFTMSDPGGSANLIAMAMLFNSSVNLNNACSMVWDSVKGTISLEYNIQANGATPVVPGTNETASNAQCTLFAANSTVAIGPTSVVVTVDLQFDAAFAGAKNIYLYAAEATTNSGWVQVGTWTVTSGSPIANSVAPSSGAGHFPEFVFTATDSADEANIGNAGMLFTVGSPANIANACYAVINRTTNTVGLYDNTGTVLSTKAIGASGPLENSQCAIGYSSVTSSASGTSVLFTLQIEFVTGPFSGAKSVYFEVNEPTSTTGWVSVGTWTAQ